MRQLWIKSEFPQLPRNLTAKEFRPGFLMGPDESAIGDGAVHSMLCNSVAVTGVSFPLYLLWFHDVDALSIEGAWLKLPLIRKGKPARGTNAGRQNKGRMTCGAMLFGRAARRFRVKAAIGASVEWTVIGRTRRDSE